MEKPSKEVRGFSREHSPEDRIAAARAIQEKRQEHFAEKRDIAARITGLEAKAQEESADWERILQGVERLREEIGKNERSGIKKVFNFLKLKKLHERLGQAELTSEAAEQEYRETADMLAELQANLLDKKKLNEGTEMLSKFYTGESAKWNQYEKEQKESTVEHIAEKYGVTFVHGIHPNYVPGENSLLNEDVNWKTKLKILLALEPTVSTSTLREGVSHRGMWSRMGVILNGGKVFDAHSSDAATVAISLNKRSRVVDPGKPILEKIDYAVTQGRSDTYNELVVENPAAAGLYISMDEPEDRFRDNIVPPQYIAEAAHALNMPFYAIKEGVVHEAVYNETTQSLELGKNITPTELFQNKFTLPYDEKAKILSEIFENSPFRIKSPEVRYVATRDSGKEAYIELVAAANPDMHVRNIFTYEADRYEHGHVVKKNEQAGMIAEFFEIGTKIKYFSLDGKLFRRREDKNKRPHLTRVEAYDEYKDGGVSLGGTYHTLSVPVENVASYTSGMEQSILELSQRIKESEMREKRYEGEHEFLEEWRDKLAFHLYGFGEQAETMGDKETKEKVFALAEQVVPYEKYRDVIVRRVGPNGQLKITMEDIAK